MALDPPHHVMHVCRARPQTRRTSSSGTSRHHRWVFTHPCTHCISLRLLAAFGSQHAEAQRAIQSGSFMTRPPPVRAKSWTADRSPLCVTDLIVRCGRDDDVALERLVDPFHASVF